MGRKRDGADAALSISGVPPPPTGANQKRRVHVIYAEGSSADEEEFGL